MAAEDDQDRGDRSAAGAGRSQDPRVEGRRPDPAGPPTPARTLLGFLGDSDRRGFRRLYFTRELDYYAEFRVDDVLHVEEIAPEQQPFVGEQATRVLIRRDATVEYTRTHTPRPVDEFDLDVRLASRRDVGAWRAETWQTECARCAPTVVDQTCEPTCGDIVTCDAPCRLPVTVLDPTCDRTCAGATCDTGCCRIREPHPSQIETACSPPCPVHR
ncbi:MAG TPA: hypothetical protein VG474_12330 [Solirubrobacteraceae bacterium]|nr:hypothetical protein [Solirubrobacteraceae bacterium]